MLTVLVHVGFGDLIFKRVPMAYIQCPTSIMLNTGLFNDACIYSLVGQGCPLFASFFFALYFQPFCLHFLIVLMSSISSSKSVRGFTLNSTEVGMLPYADDIAIFCGDIKNGTEVMSLTKSFCEATSASV